MPQTLKIIIADVPIAACHDFHQIGGKRFCGIRSQSFHGDINVTGFVQGMFFQDESGKYWGPFSSYQAHLPAVDR